MTPGRDKPNWGTNKGKSLNYRLWQKVNVRGEGDCWPWLGASNRSGRGQLMAADGRKRSVPQLIWEDVNEQSFPEGKEACHTCDNPPCCNPKHIWTGTRTENIIDSVSKGRWDSRGRAHKTHCKHNHEYTAENTHITPQGHRHCRVCNNLRQNERRRQSRRAA
jgi:hypothetical protein